MKEIKLAVYYEVIEPDEDGDARIRVLPDARWIGVGDDAVFEGFAPGEEGVQSAIYHLQATLLDDLETRWDLRAKPSADDKTALLRRALWLLREVETEGCYEGASACPACGGDVGHDWSSPEPHAPIVDHNDDCELAALIAEIEGVTSA